jgi:amino acid efflux transporter
MAAGSRLCYALARDGAFPRFVERLSPTGVPRLSIAVIATVALGGLLLSYLMRFEAEYLVFVSSTLGAATYIAATAAACRLLRGRGRAFAAISFIACLAIFFFGGPSIVITVLVAGGSLVFHRLRGRDGAIASRS